MSNKSLGSLTAMELQTCVKNGCGISYLAKKYDCLEDQLVTRIKRMYKKTPKKAQKMLTNLRENDRKARKNAKGLAEVDSNEDILTNEPAMQTAELCKSQLEACDGEVAEEPQTEATENTLDDLAGRECELSEAVRKLELLHRDSADLHRGNLTAKRAVLKRLGELEREITDLGQEYEDLCLESDEQEAEMERLNALRKEKAEELAKVREQMREAQQVVVFIYDDETISAPESDVALDDSGYEKISSKLIKRPECRRLAVWEIELLARVIRITAYLENLKLSTEFVFENQPLEEAYRQLVAQYETVKRMATML